MELFKLFGKIVIDNKDAINALDETTENAKKNDKKINDNIKTAAKWAVGLTTAAATATVALVKHASSSETAFAKTKTLLTGSEDELTAYKESMIKASNETGVSMEDMCESVYGAISAGQDQADAIAFVTQANQLAKGGFTETATAVDVMTTALNAYGLEADDASKISDVLITTQNLGKTTVDELASSMGKIIPTASAYGVNIENLGASYATVTAGGIATAEATTYMNSMFNELADSGTDVGKILQEKTGKSFGQLMSDGASLGDVLEIVNDSVNGDKEAFSKLWGSAEAGKAALSIASTGADEFNTTLKDMENSSGATETAASTMGDTLDAKITKIKNSFSNFTDSLGQNLLPIVEKIVDDLLPRLQEKMENTAEWVSNHKEVLIALGTAIGVVATALVAYNVVQAVKSAMNAVEATSLWGLVTAKLADAAATMAALAPYLLIVAAITAVIAVIVVCVKHWDKIKEKVTEVAKAIKEKITEMKDKVVSKFEELNTKVQNKIEELKQKVKAKFNEIKEKIISPINNARDKIVETFTNIKTSLNEKIEAIKSSVTDKFNSIKEKITTPIENAKEKIKSIVDKIKGFFTGLKLSFPNIKTPHFKLNPTGWKVGDLLKGSIPKLGIDWYAKAMDDGMVMNEPTIFGVNGKGQPMAGGEAGSETVVGTESLMTMIQASVNTSNTEVIVVLNKILSLLISMDDSYIIKLTNVLKSLSIKWDERELARLVKKYA